jgi:large subunit ribosomal protein L32e
MAERKASLPQKALKARKRAKKKKPDFVRSESWRYVKLKESWRRPRGLDHKMRRKIKGWPPTVSVGYKGPKVARGLHPSGYKEVLVHNAKEVSNIDPKTEAARIAHTVGKRKRVQIIAEAKKKKVYIVNFKPLKELVEKEEEKPEEAEEAEEKPTEKKKKPAKKAPKPVRKRVQKKPVAKKKKEKEPAEKEAKPKRRFIGGRKVAQKEQKSLVKKDEKPKKTRKKAKTEKGVEKQ